MQSPYYLKSQTDSPSVSLFSQQQAEDLTSQLFCEAEEEVSFLHSKNKSKSVKFLPTISVIRSTLDAENIRRTRINGYRRQIKEEIQAVQTKCQKFGGSNYIKAEMNNQSISMGQRAKFYKKRIQGIHGSLSLPRIPHVRGEGEQEKVKVHKKLSEQAKAKSKSRKAKDYNKWYVSPQNRFSYREKASKEKASSIQNYIQQVLTQGTQKRELKMAFAPSIIKSSLLKLGREPLVCASTKITHG